MEESYSKGMFVTKINNKSVENAASMRNKIGLLKINSTITIQINRKGKTLTKKVKIVEPDKAKIKNLKLNPRLAGLIFGDIKKNMPEYGKVTGIKIMKMRKDSKAFAAGIRPNDIILSINNIPLQELKDLEIAANNNDELVLHVQRQNRTAFILLK